MSELKVKKPWYTRWWAITLFVLIGLGIIGSFLEPESLQGSSGQKAGKNLLFSGSPVELLPTRQELPTEFRIGSTEDLVLNISGFESGKKMSTSKIEGSLGLIGVDYNVYKFTSANDATTWYNSEMNRVKELGGYTEIGISGCFAWKEDYGIEGEAGEASCLNDNVVYVVEAYSAKTFKRIDGFMKDGVSLIKKKLG